MRKKKEKLDLIHTPVANLKAAEERKLREAKEGEKKPKFRIQINSKTTINVISQEQVDKWLELYPNAQVTEV